ncbi:HlyD family type I secretion periplasmic adaptor subunit [Inquilinus sp. OTU3971]|uniref:HlyD family type I secretion periplasmic adaptor subunit n=1 Tax=Inquilinus sp. OTU3971 TaxID=3043855 RepID=UPI00313D4123
MWELALEHWQKLLSTLNSADTPEMAVRIAAPVLACGMLLLLWFAVRRRRATIVDATSLARMTRGPRVLGYGALLLLTAGFGSWSVTAPLAGAAIAPGVVSPDGHRKTIQHLEGGIIRGIHVREGDFVAAGATLVTLEDVQARAKYVEIRERYTHVLAVKARLNAEAIDAREIDFPTELVALGSGEAERAMAGQEALLRSRRATFQGKERILGQRVKQLEEEITGLRQMIAAQDAQLALLDQEIAGVQELYNKGLERLPRLLALQRASADIGGEQAENRAKIARNGQEIGETEMQLLTMRQQQREDVDEELTKVAAELAELRSQFPSREDILTRTTIQAPISGTVMNVRITTATGVIRPGEPILDIVPTEAKLIIDAQIKPTDIDVVRPGMTARVLLTAYRQRNLPQIHGTLRSISADRLVEDKSGTAYYLAKVEVDPSELSQLDGVRLIAGMPTEVMILTGERTLLDYLLRPLLDSITRSFRES